MRKKLYINDYLALALICFTIIVYQLSLTKMLSAVAWYHFTFLTLSLVMLGMGAPGIWLATVKNPARLLPYLLFLGGVSLVGSEMLIMHSISRIAEEFSRALMLVVSILVPMFCLGGCVCIYLMKAEGKNFGKMYACDLFGAFTGAVLTVPAIMLIPVPHIIALLGALILCVLIANTGKLRLLAALGLLGIASLFVIKEPLNLTHSKYEESGLGRVYEKWTPVTRITVFDNIFWSSDPDKPVDPDHGFAWGAGTKFPLQKIKQYWIEQDSSAGTPITEFDGKNLDKLDYLLYDVTSSAYLLRKPRHVAIIGGGGGRDILTALKAGVEKVKVIELNKTMVDAVSNEFRAFSGDIYHHKQVDVAIAEGRSYLATSGQSYDLIQISLIDSWAASMAGAFALAENNLYTKEAYKTYFSRLNENGVVTTSRWLNVAASSVSAYEVQRLVLLIYEALADMGVKSPEKHIALISSKMVGNVIASKSPFSDADIATMRAVAAKHGFTISYPVQPGSKPEHDYARLLSPEHTAVLAELDAKGIDISPPTDDRPFFFNVLKPFPLKLSVILTDVKNNAAVQVMQNAVIIVILLTIVLYFVPFIDNYKLRLLPYRDLLSSSIYFAVIGFGFMAMEIFMIQKFILYMGNPAYSASVVLGCLLLGLAAGAYASTRTSTSAYLRAAWLMPCLLVVMALVMQPLFSGTLHYGFVLKIAVAFIILFPCAFVGGFFFPAGVARFGDAGKPWFWAINGSFGVFSSAIALPVAMVWGYSSIIWAAVAAYLIAVLIISRGGRCKVSQ
jgi:spermidine synthase